jgi:hypothetical protein
MAETLDRQEMYRLAKLGAEARLEALEAERSQILRAFPGLRAGRTPAAQAAPSQDVPVRRRREMNAAERKSVSLRMKKYWAERRKAKAAAAAAAAAKKD